MRTVRYLLVALLVLGVCSCNGLRNGGLVWGGDFVVQLGYEASSESVDYEFEHEDHLDGTVFVAFADKEAIEEAEKVSTTEGEEPPFVKGENNFEFVKEPTKFILKTYPEIAQIKSYSIESSDPSILEILGTDGNDIGVRTKNLGEVTLRLTVDGPAGTVVKEYPIRVYYKVQMNFYITPFWLKDVFNTRIRYKVLNLPPGMKTMFTEVKDSVSVVGYCESYDFNRSREPKIRRDTFRFELQDRIDRFRKNHRVLVENITPAMLYFRSKTETGNRYVLNPYTFEYELQPFEYSYLVEQVILDFNVVCDNPNVEFIFNSKYDKTFDTYDEKTGEIVDSGTDAPEDDGGNDSEPELKKSEKKYFQVLLNSFMSKDERKKLQDKLNKTLKDNNVNSSMSDAELDAKLEDINSHKKND